MITKSNSAQRIKLAMDKLHLNQTEIYMQTGIPKATISQYLSGIYEPKQDRIALLANILHVSEAWLMGFGEDWDTKFGINEIDNLKQTVELILTPEEQELIKTYRKLDEYAKEFFDIQLEYIAKRSESNLSSKNIK